MNKNLKKLSAITLAATMMLGSTVTVLATDTSSSGTGTYEGGEMKYPAISVTLPTIPTGTYDYIADPNGLIAATSNEKYSGAVFTGTTGIYFKTDSDNKKYTENSATLKAKNESAMDVDITVKLEQETAGAEIIKYAESSTFAGTDNELYLAVTDGTTTKAIKSATEAAVITTKVEGIPGNYEAKYDSGTGKYGYALKSSGTTDWKECSFNLTGALNTNATWEDDVTFPTIKVTWSYAEHSDDAAPTLTGKSVVTITSDSNAGQSLTIPMSLGAGTLAATSVTKVECNGGVITTDKYSVSGSGLELTSTFVDAMLSSSNVADRVFKIYLNDSANTTLTFTIKR